jgi:transcriptional regulator with XRE-family HTH domain
MDIADQSLDMRIAERVRSLRTERQMTLEDLATLSGVSRAMISRIERGETSPTAALLNRLCAAFDLSLSAFFGGKADRQGSPLSRRDRQPLWTDPQTGYQRWSVSPFGTGSPVDIVEVVFPAGSRLVFSPMEQNRGLSQHLWLMEGSLQMAINDVTYLMAPGDCLFMDVGDQLTFHNPGPLPARYAVIYNNQRLAR